MYVVFINKKIYAKLGFFFLLLEKAKLFCLF